MLVARAKVEVLGIPQRLVHMTIHCVQHAFESTGPFEDLRRAVATVDRTQWEQAAAVSRAMGSEDALAAGLCLIPEGAALSAALGLTTERRGVVRMAASTHNDLPAFQLQRIIDAESTWERIKLLVNPILVSPSMLREDSALARRGGAGLVVAYAARPFVLARRMVPALRARRRILESDA